MITSPSRNDLVSIVHLAAERASKRRIPAENALADACAERGVDPVAFDRAIAEDPELDLLKRTALRDAAGDDADPGPHDRISRESPSGQPGDLHKNRTYSEPDVRSRR